MAVIKVKDEIVVNKTGVWYFSAEILKKYGIKNTGANQYVVMCWLKNNNSSIIENDFIQRNSKVKIPASKIDVLQIFCKELKLNQNYTDFFDLIECDHEVDGAIDVAKYIVQEIKTNINSQVAKQIYALIHYNYDAEVKRRGIIVSTLAPPYTSTEAFGGAVLKWIEMVNTKKPWDHKGKIFDLFSYCAVKDRVFKRKDNTYGTTSSQYHKYQYHDYFLDVWSNIHYGFVGRYCGFSEKTLLTGSDIQQFAANFKKLNFKGGDDPADKITMQLGMDLYTEYKNKIDELTYQIILDKLENLESIGESRLLHKCFDTSSNGVTYL